MVSILRSTRSLSVIAILVASLVSFALLANQAAEAQEVPTTGTSATATGGQAWTAFIGDLKKFDTPPSTEPPVTPCNSLFLGYVVCEGDYDDDPGADPQFHVSPNNADNPIQHAWKAVVFDFHPVADPTGPAVNDIKAIQKEIFWVAAHPNTTGDGLDENPAGQRVLHEIVNYRDPVTGAVIPNVILTGNDCNVLGAPGVDGTIADGLVQTGQATAAAVNGWLGDCIQNEAGFHLNNWTVSKHLPPGQYNQCITLIHTNGAQTAVVCQTFVINPTVNYNIDFAQGINWTGLASGNTSVVSGDFVFPGSLPSIQGDGNTSLVFGVRYTPVVTPTGKIIWSEFDAQLNRRGPAGTVPIEWQHIGGIAAGPAAGVWSAWFDFAGPTVLGAGALGPTSGAVCLEPNEPLKVDFSLTPLQAVFDTVIEGAYAGLLEVRAQLLPVVCTPSLDHGESTTGDSSGVFDNNPSQGGPLPFP